MSEAEPSNVVYVEFPQHSEVDDVDEVAALEQEWEAFDRIIEKSLARKGIETTLYRLRRIDK